MAENEVIKITADTSDIRQKLADTADRLDKAAAMADRLGSKLKAAMSDGSKAVRDQAGTVDKLSTTYRRALSSLSGIQGRLASATQAMHRATDAQAAGARKLDEQTAKAREMQEAYDRLSTIMSDFDVTARGFDGVKALDEYLEKSAKDAEDLIQALTDGLNEAKALGSSAVAVWQGSKLTTMTRGDASNLLGATQNNLADYTAERAALQGALSRVPEQYRKMGSDSGLAELAGKVRDANAAAQAQNQTLADLAGKADAAKTALAGVALSEQDAAREADEAGRKYEESANKLTAMTSVSGRVKTGLASVGSAAAKGAASIAGKIPAAMKQTGAAISRVSSDVNKKAKDLFDKFNKMPSLTRQVSNAFNSLGAVARRIINRAIVSNFFSAFTAGFQALAKQDTQFNAAISRMGAALKTFADTCISAAAPLIEAVAPAVESVISAFTRGMDAAARFTARITGNKSYSKAAGASYDYAKSLDNQTAKTKKTTDAQKELNRTLLSFDQIHKLGSTQAGTTNADGASADLFRVGTPADLDKTNRLEAGLSKLADDIKKHDWKSLGADLAAGVNGAFAWADKAIGWDNAGKKIIGIVDGLADSINGFFAGLNAGTIGNSIGDILNTAIYGTQEFLAKTDFGSIGTKLGEIARNALNKTDWQTAGADLINGIQAALTLVGNFLGTPGLAQAAGQAVNQFFTGAIKAFNPDTVAGALDNAINGVLIFVENALNVKKAKELGKKIGETVAKFLAGISPDDFAGAVNDICESIIGFITGFFSDEKEWGKALKNIGKALTKIDWGALAGVITLAIAPALAGSFMSTLGGVLLKMGVDALIANPAAVIPVLIGLCVAAIVAIVWKHRKEIGAALKKLGKHLAGIAKTVGGWIIDPFKAIWDDLKTIADGVIDLAKKAWDGIKSLFGGDSGKATDLYATPTSAAYAIPYTKHAAGGFVSDGQLFLARESGPEMVGQIGGQTAVANNGQIVQAVSAGVAKAVAGVLTSYQGGESDGGELAIYLDGEQVYRGLAKARDRYGARTGAAAQVLFA